jgi:hypothetical protein
MDYNYYRRRHHSARRHMLEVEMPMEAADDDSSISSADHFVGGIEGLAEGRSSRSLLSSPHFYDVWVRAKDLLGRVTAHFVLSFASQCCKLARVLLVGPYQNSATACAPPVQQTAWK